MKQVKHPSASRATNFIIASVVLLLISACGSGDDKPVKEPANLTGATFKMNCVRLEKAQIQRWVDSGWTNPANPATLIKKILLQFYSTDGANANENMRLMTYPAKNYTVAYASGKEETTIDTTCVSLNLTGKTLFANNYVGLSWLDILKADGTLKDFTFLRFRPVQRPEYDGYITFIVEVVRVAEDKTESVLNGEGKGTDPCPTFCEDPGGPGGF